MYIIKGNMVIIIIFITAVGHFFSDFSALSPRIYLSFFPTSTINCISTIKTITTCNHMLMHWLTVLIIELSLKPTPIQNISRVSLMRLDDVLHAAETYCPGDLLDGGIGNAIIEGDLAAWDRAVGLPWDWDLVELKQIGQRVCHLFFTYLYNYYMFIIANLLIYFMYIYICVDYSADTHYQPDTDCIIHSIIYHATPQYKDIMNLLHTIALLLCLNLAMTAVTVTPITGITTNNLMYTGTIAINGYNLFFTYYGADGQTNPDSLAQKPLLIAVGAPGRSAQYGNLGGLGPKVLTRDLSVVDNGARVTVGASVMFVDLPGAGFSFGDNLPKSAAEYGAVLTKAINAFVAESNLGKSKSVYLLGQATFLRAVPGLDDIDALKGIIHIAGWFDLYGIGKYYGTAGVEQKIFNDSERITIEATFTNCYNFQRSSKFTQAHSCYDTTLNYVQSKTKNRNLFNIQLVSNLTQFLPLVQYYFSQSSTVAAYKAPNTYLFESQSAQVQANLYEDLAKNIDAAYSQYLKDYLSVKQVFITADDDFITYRRATRNWLENSLTFIDSAKFKPMNLSEYQQNGKVVGYRKSVTQIAYYELLNAGHFSYNDQPAVIAGIAREVMGLGEVVVKERVNLVTE